MINNICSSQNIYLKKQNAKKACVPAFSSAPIDKTLVDVVCKQLKPFENNTRKGIFGQVHVIASDDIMPGFRVFALSVPEQNAERVVFTRKTPAGGFEVDSDPALRDEMEKQKDEMPLLKILFGHLKPHEEKRLDEADERQADFLTTVFRKILGLEA